MPPTLTIARTPVPSGLDKEHFEKRGFCILKNFFQTAELDQFEQTLLELFAQQGKKIDEYRDAVTALCNSTESRYAKLSRIYELMETKDKEALYQVQKFLPSSPALRGLTDSHLPGLLTELEGGELGTTLIDGPALFANRPNTERLLYKWHSEAHYYPKRRRFLNVWFPVFDNKTKACGTMSFKVGTHKNHYPFAEYYGFNKDTENKANHFLQYEIPENFLVDFEEFFCEVNRGDLVVFHANLVHRSNLNLSNHYSFAMVVRLWNPIDDLTLSGLLTATPYGGDKGRSGLIVDPHR